MSDLSKSEGIDHRTRFGEGTQIGKFTITKPCVREDRIDGEPRALYYIVEKQTKGGTTKYLMKVILVPKNERKCNESEAEITKKLGGGAFILKTFGFEESHGFEVLVMPRFPTLADYITDGKRLSIAQTQAIAEQLCHALRYIHSQKYVHRTINPSNIFLYEQDDSITAYLANFAGAAQVDTLPATRDRGWNDPKYTPPEVIDGEAYSYAADVWSLGVCLSELVQLTDGGQANGLRELSSQMSQKNKDARITMETTNDFVQAHPPDVFYEFDVGDEDAL